MNEEFFNKISTRVYLLEETVSKIQEKIRGTYFKDFKNVENYKIKVLPSYKSYDDESCVLDVDDGLETQTMFTNNRMKDLEMLSKINVSKIKNISIEKITLNEQGTNMMESSEYRQKPTCMMKIKQNWLYHVLWAIVNVLAMIVSYIYIKNAYDSWQSSPVVQALSNSQVHIENISFPAVTICWPNGFNRDYDLFNNIERCVDCETNSCIMKNMTCNYTDMATLVLAKEICSKYFLTNPFPKKIFQYVPRMLDKNEFNTYMEKLLPECESDEVTTKMSYGNEPFKHYTRCDGDVFQQFYTHYPKMLCMTYNGLRHKYIYKENVVTPIPLAEQVHNKPLQADQIWSFDNMMQFNGNWNTEPIYGLDGFSIAIPKQIRSNQKNCNILGKDVASVIIHSPNEIPVHFENAIDYAISNNVRLEMMVLPKITLAREDLAQYPPHQRGCLFTHENNLSMFKFYTKNNCDVECLINSYLESCGCVPYNYPRQNGSVRVCIQPCEQPKYQCECLPDCNSLTYDITTQESSILGYVLSNYTVQAIVEIKLKGNKYYTTLRYSITSYAEFLAYSLGVLGAFLGFSVTCVWRLLFSGLKHLWTSVKTLSNNIIAPL